MFFAVLAVIVGLEHLYLYRRLVRATTRSRRLRWVGGALLAVGWALVASSRLLAQGVLGSASRPVVFVAWTWFGLSLYLFLFSAVVHAAGALAGLGARLGRRRGASRMAQSSEPPERSASGLSRRELFAKAGAGAAAVASVGLGSYGLVSAFSPAEISEVAFRVPKLPRTLDGFTIVQISDLHIGTVLGRRFLEDVVQRCNALKPDLVAVTGDLVDEKVSVLAPTIATLRKLRSRHGTWFITGNHEYYVGADEWCAAISKMGIGVLRNRFVSIGDAGGAFDLVGVDDWGAKKRHLGHGYDLDAALAGRRPDRAAVLLAHEPANFREAIDRGMGLQLSGHTHGGQMFPWTYAVDLKWHPSRGRLDYRDGAIYVSRGTGFWGAPMRVGSPPEIVHVTLTA